MSLKSRDNHNRWRNKTVAFRVSPEEDAQIETFVKLSGLTKQDYITRRLTGKDVVVQGNPRVYKALRDQLAAVLNELHIEPPDHVLESVSRLVSAEQPVWTGSPSELADAVHVGMAANALSKYLNVKSGRLLDEYRVHYENKVRHEGRRITLTYDTESK